MCGKCWGDVLRLFTWTLIFIPSFPPQNLISRYYAIKNRLQLFKDFYPATCFSREDLSLIPLLYHSSLVSSALGWIKITGLNQGSSSHLISRVGGGDLMTDTTRQSKFKQRFFFLLNLDMCHWNAWALISLFKNGNNFITWGCKIK